MVFAFLVRQIGALPVVLRNGVWRLVLRRKRIPRTSPSATLPTVGLDERALQSLIFTLRQEGAPPELVAVWLTATQLTQIIIDRLLGDMRMVVSNLEYWQKSPIQTFKRAMTYFQGNNSELSSATDLIEKRIWFLRALETLLTTSLADVHEAAVRLRLDDVKSEMDDAKTELPKRVHVQLNLSLTQICNVLRKLKFESALLQDQNRMERQIAGVDLTRSTTSTGASPPQSSSLMEATPKDSEKANYDIAILHELLAKGRDHLSLDVHCDATQSVSHVMQKTRMLSQMAISFVSIPQWAQRPSRLQRHWVRYTLYSILGFSVIRYLFMHSPLAGSDDMYRWAQSVKFAAESHVMGPLRNLTEEIFDTFHGAPGIVSMADYELSKQSLIRMLKDFKQDDAKRSKTDTEASDVATDQESLLEGMDTLMRTYEAELKNPLKNVVTGQLARALLIQVQKLKVDTESAMLELDQILRANELNVALIAAIPSILVAAGVLYFLYGVLFNRAGPDPYKSLIPCRLALVELQRALDHVLEGKGENKEAVGQALYRLERTYRACWNVFKSRDISSSESEWPSLRKDFLDLSRPLSIEQKTRVCERMRLNYSVFQVE